MDFDVELGKEYLAQVEQANVHVAALYELGDQFRRKRLPGFKVA
jgi:hypothetical protein